MSSNNRVFGELLSVCICIHEHIPAYFNWPLSVCVLALKYVHTLECGGFKTGFARRNFCHLTVGLSDQTKVLAIKINCGHTVA